MSLIKEFQLKEEQELLNKTYFVLEHVGNFIQPIRNKLDDAVKSNRNPFDGNSPLSKEWTAAVLGVLLGFAKDQGSSEMLDGIDGNLKRLLTFYAVLGDKDKSGVTQAHARNAGRAEEYIQHWAKTSFKSKVKEVSDILELFKDTNSENYATKEKFVRTVNRMSYDLLNQMNKLKNKLSTTEKEKSPEVLLPT